MPADETNLAPDCDKAKAAAQEVWNWSPLDGVTRNAAGEVIIRFADDAADFAAQTRRGRLASAAPDLLEALKAMCVSHENLYRVVFGEVSDPQADIIRKDAEAAIARATGGA